jgi:hypothetical protein
MAPDAEILRGARWFKSTHSNPNGECVEIAILPRGLIAIRDSRRRRGPALVFPVAHFAAFISKARVAAEAA